ncbi:MAG: plasmid pRiA4b ORF-3 family protein [Candidatus Magasanikbacteria bacterium]
MSNIYQFKITLQDSKPPIWRRIQVSENYTFWDLHVAINEAMGWYDCHLHAFVRRNLKTLREELRIHTDLADEPWDLSDEVKEERETLIKDVLTLEKPRIKYDYDFGDSWQHYVVLEKILPAEKGVEYPRCVAGKRACPPEDVGAIWGYYDFVKIMNNPQHSEYKEMVEWIGEDSWDPDEFNPDEVFFDDPEEIWDEMQKSSF